MTLNGSGIRDTSRVLKVSPTTVLKTIYKEAERIPEMSPESCSIEAVEIDEQWSYMSNKGNQQWLWNVWDRDNKKIIYYVVGKRTDESCEELLKGIKVCQIEDYHTDNWQSYRKSIPRSKHFVSKMETQRIERNNLNFRTHLKRLNRKTICFSKSEDMHKAVIKLYINYANSKAS
jgi:IS1 family transposase